MDTRNQVAPRAAHVIWTGTGACTGPDLCFVQSMSAKLPDDNPKTGGVNRLASNMNKGT
jgi:hypothetical protein